MNSIIKTIQEVVLAVKDQDKAVAFFEEIFGLKFDQTWEMPADNMRVKAATIGETQFQVVASTSPDGLIAKFIQDRGEGIHHIAFKVDKLDDLILKLKERGIKLVPSEARMGRPGTSTRYIFTHPKFTFGLLIELLEVRETGRPAI